MSPTFDEAQRPYLEWLFRSTLIYLAVIIAGALLYAASQVSSDRPTLLLLCIAAGIAGSATGALVSALNRHADGLEDRNGGTTPEPEAKKERFNEGMFYWFLMRPWLGAVVAAGIFWGMASGQLADVTSESDLSPTRVAFYGLLAGLFAKSVLDILRNLPKNIFKQ